MIILAVRSLRRAPAYSVASIGTLSLSIAALALAYAFANAFFFRPMPFRNDHELVGISSTRKAASGEVLDFAVSSTDYLTYLQRSKTMGALAAINSQSYALMVGDLPESIDGALVSATMWPLLGTNPIAGRVFTEAEDVKGAPIAVISERLRRRLFPDGASTAIGQSIRLNGSPVTVIGVMPAGFRPRMNPGDVWLPMGVTPSAAGAAVTRQMQVVGRLKPGATLAAATADIEGIAASMASELPDHKDWGASVKPLRAKIGDSARPVALTLLAAVSFLLVLTAANLANLAVARAARQRADISTRFALGASSASIMRQQAAESLVIALAGATVGIAAARLLLPPTLAMMTSDNPLLSLVEVDWRVIACVTAVSVLTGLAASMLPAAHAVRMIGADVLASGGRRAVVGVKERRLRTTLMAVQVSVAAVLLVGSFGAVIALRDATSYMVGYDPTGVVAARLTLPASRYSTLADRNRFTTAVLERLVTTPGIAMAALTTSRFIPGASIQGSFVIEGQPADAPTIAAEVRRVDGDYFGAMRISLQEGRLFTTPDRDSMPPVVIVNRAFVKQYLAARPALGTRIIRGTNPPATIVGVVPDVRDGGQAENIGAMVYLPFRQSAAAFATFIMRSPLPPSEVEKLVRQAVRSVDPMQPFDRIAPLEQYLSESLGEDRFKTVLLGSLAALALLLACLGIYGVTSYLMQERAREVAIKLALGATNSRLLGEFVTGSVITVGASAAVGVALSVVARVGLARWIGDAGALPVSLYPVVLVVLIGIGTAAAWMPAFRASRTSPGAVLR